MLHYNMPPYATGETGRVGTPKRREIGHGRLAKRALVNMLPTAEEFAYSMRVVSEITESNGSSSMASRVRRLSRADGCRRADEGACGRHRHGTDQGRQSLCRAVSDILGDEDHLGDMDFKVAGTERGVTALQMDIKIQGITKEIMQVALSQAREGRMHILSQMKQALESPRPEISAYAPRMIVIKIKPEKIRDVIGKGGAVIRAITEETGTTIDIAEDGTVTIACISSEGGLAAKKRIEDITADVEVGRVYDGTVLKLLDFGAIVSVLARQGRTAAHLPDRRGARQERRRPPQGRPVGARQGARGRRQGSAAPVDEGGGGDAVDLSIAAAHAETKNPPLAGFLFARRGCARVSVSPPPLTACTTISVNGGTYACSDTTTPTSAASTMLCQNT